MLFAVLAAVAVALLPLGSSSSDSAVSEGGGASIVEETTSRHSLLSSEGPRVLAIVATPVLVTAVPLVAGSSVAARRVRIASTFLLGVLVILGAASIGLAFVPALFTMIAASASSPATSAGVSISH